MILFTLLCSVVLFIVVAHSVFVREEELFDKFAFDWVAAYTNEQTIALMSFLTFFGKPDFLIPAYLLLIVYSLVKRRQRRALNIFLIGASSTGLLFGLKELFGRSRPDYPLLQTLGGYSFPSGHAFLFFVFAYVLAYMVFKSSIRKVFKYSIAFLLLVFAIAVGITRIFLRYHYASDVVAGFCIGITYVATFLWIQERKEGRQQFK